MPCIVCFLVPRHYQFIGFMLGYVLEFLEVVLDYSGGVIIHVWLTIQGISTHIDALWKVFDVFLLCGLY